MAKKALQKELIREYSAGGVVYQKTKSGEKWLLIQPAGTTRWQFPKGLIGPDESVVQAAEREVEEEGGVKVKVIQKVGSTQFFYVWEGRRRLKTVSFFLMEFLGNSQNGPDSEVDQADFFDFKEAVRKLSFKDEKDILKKAKNLLQSALQENLL